MEVYFPFSLRRALFTLFELWCGFGVNSSASRRREAEMMSLVLDPIKDQTERGYLFKKMEVHRKSIQLASLKAIGSLLKGPLQNGKEPQIEVQRVIAWINGLLDSSLNRYRKIASGAIESILSFNSGSAELFEDIVENCYIHPDVSNITIGYFIGLVDLFCKEDRNDISIGSTVCLALYHMGSDAVVLRNAASRLLIAIDRKMQTNGSPVFFEDTEPAEEQNDEKDDLEDAESNGKGGITFESSCISSSLPAVYKYARLQVSRRLASERPAIVYDVIYFDYRLFQSSPEELKYFTI
jgi:hypothetical protein